AVLWEGAARSLGGGEQLPLAAGRDVPRRCQPGEGANGAGELGGGKEAGVEPDQAGKDEDEPGQEAIRRRPQYRLPGRDPQCLILCVTFEASPLPPPFSSPTRKFRTAATLVLPSPDDWNRGGEDNSPAPASADLTHHLLGLLLVFLRVDERRV